MGTSRKKGVAPPRYDEAFTAGAVKLVTEQGRPSTEMSKELGICIDTLRNWLKALAGVSTGQANRQNREVRRLRELEAEKDEVIDVLKNPWHTFKTIEEKYRYVKADRSGASVVELCQALAISRSVYHAWRSRKPSARTQRDQALTRALVQLHKSIPPLG